MSSIIQRILNMGRETAAEPDAVTGAKPEDQFSHMIAMGSLVTKIREGYSVIAAIAGHESFFKSTYSWAPNSNSARQRNAEEMFKVAGNGAFERRVINDGKATTVFIDLASLEIRSYGLPAEATGEQAKEKETSLGLLRALFPKIRAEELQFNNGNVMLGDDYSNDLPIESLAAINIPGVGRLELSDWDQRYKGVVKFRVVPEFISLEGDSRATLSVHSNYRLLFKVVVQVALPMDYCLWATSSTKEDYIPLSMFQFFKKRYSWFQSEKPATPEPAASVQHVDALARQTRRLSEDFGITPVVKCNAEGICSVPEGKLYWVPDGNDVSVPAVLNSCVDEAGNIDFEHLISRHLVTDWSSDKMLATDENGTIHAIDLTGARAPSPEALAHVATAPMERWLGGLASLAEKLGLKFDRSPINIAMGILARHQQVLSWENLLDVPFSVDEQYENLVTRLYAVGSQLGDMYEKLSTTDTIPLYSQYELRPYLALFGPYRSRRAEFTKAHGERIAHNRMSVTNELTTLHDMPGVDGIMPHQVRVGATLSTNPKGAILNIRAGGGKSWAMIHDVTDLFFKHKIKRPAIVMPRNLLPQFARELTKFTKGRIRPFIITQRVWRKLIRRVGSNPLALKELMARQPGNTVFLIDYNWLMLGSMSVDYGDGPVESFPNATTMAQIGFDYVAFDESQRAKKLSAGRTMAASVLSGAVAASPGGGYIRLSSGTIIHNTARDLIGQMAMIEPMALGPVATTLKENDRVPVKDQPELRHAMECFARDIFVSRKEWAHLLPPVVERVHPCSLSAAQQKYYDFIMATMAKQAANDPRIKKWLKKGDTEQAQAKLATLFQKYFGKVEVFINAPDDETMENTYSKLFQELDYVHAEDLVSPKVAVVDELIRQQLEGGTVDIGGEEIQTEPSKNKILILGYNKAVSIHIMKHSKFKGRLLHYTAGDDKIIDKFKKDPNYIGIVADETAIQEGHNLQLCDRIIRIQTLYVPGAQEQAHARVWRPSVPDKDGNIEFPRDRIFIDWILCSPSIEVAKMARLIGKQVENQLLEETAGSKSLQNIVDANKPTFGAIKRIAMSLEMINRKDLQTVEALQTQFDAYALLKKWELGEFRENAKKQRAIIEERIGRKVKNYELGPLSMQKVGSVDDPAKDPGTSLQGTGYVPWVDGFSGYNPTGLHLEPLTLPEDDDEDDTGGDDGEEVVENVHAEPGDPVLTEFGPGIITVARKNSKTVFVTVPGFKAGAVLLLRNNVLGTTNEVDKRALMSIVRQSGKQGLPTLKLDEKSGRLSPTVSPIPALTIEQHQKDAEKKLAEPPPKPVKVKPEVPVVRTRVPRDTDTPKQGKVSPRPTKVAPTGDEETGTRDIGAMPNGTRITLTLVRPGHYVVTDGVSVVSVMKRDIGWIAEPAWNLGESSDPMLRRPAIREARALLRAHIVKKGKKGAEPTIVPRAPTRTAGVPKSDPHFKPTRAPTADPTKAKPSMSKPQKNAAPIKLQTINLNPKKVVVSDPDAGKDVREAHAILYNGLVCLLTDDGGIHDQALLKNGFDKIGKSACVRVKNPKGYLALVDMLAKKFEIPRVNKAALDKFGEIYQAQRANVAFLKPKELPFHAQWIRDQRKKAVGKMEIRPWPVVEDGKVWIYVNVEMCPAGMRIKNLSPPPGVVKPILVAPALIAMVKGGADAKRLLKTLEAKDVIFKDKEKILDELTHIRG